MVRLTDRPDMTLDVYRGRKATKQQQSNFATELFYCEVYGCTVIFSPLLFKDRLKYFRLRTSFLIRSACC